MNYDRDFAALEIWKESYFERNVKDKAFAYFLKFIKVTMIMPMKTLGPIRCGRESDNIR